MKKRILALDVGEKRIGVAITDPLVIFSRELKLILRKNDSDAIDEIKKLAQEYDIEKIVVGLPYNVDGTIGFQAKNTMKFVKTLEKDYEIIFFDERYSSSEAEELLRKEGKKYTKDKGLVDLKSACIILEDYLRGL